MDVLETLPVLTSLDAARIAELRREGSFFWVDLEDPSTQDMHGAAELFGLHPLALEDSIAFGQRPKVDEYNDHALVVFYGVEPKVSGPTDEVPLVEVHAYVHGDFVLTIHREPCSAFDALRRSLSFTQRGEEGWIIHRILDVLTDSFFPVLEVMDDRIDELEDAIVDPEGDGEAVLQDLFELKRRLVHLRKIVTPQRDLLARAMDRLAEIPGLTMGSRDYFRDVYDHMIRISDLIDTYRDLLSGALDVYLSTVANRQNDEMKQLSLIATIFLPLSFVTGFFGQNFEWMTDRIQTGTDFLLWGIGSLVVGGAALAWYFRRRGWY